MGASPDRDGAEARDAHAPAGIQLPLPAVAAGAGDGDGAAGAGAGAGDAAAESPASLPDLPDEAAPDPSAGFLPLSRKSVTYQPVPFSWKAGADNCLAKRSCPHDGQVVSGGSEIFCSTSCWNPQSPQR